MRAPDAQLIGVVLGGRYRITKVLAAGGMGAVYEAEQLGLGRTVAIKVMHPFLGDDAEALDRFEREARIVASIGHPHVVQIHDFHRAPGEMAWLAMELVPGRSLAQVLKEEGALPPARVAAILLPLLSALDAAHAAGVIHRDLKPGNLMVTAVPGLGETAKLLDFGIAKLAEGRGAERLTRTGVVLGTPQYMAPEQALGQPIDARTDLYAVGVMTWAMLAGRPPFPRGSMAEVLEAVLETTPPPPSTWSPLVTRSLDAFVATAMAKSPTARFQTARAMADALRDVVAAPVPAGSAELGRAPSSPTGRTPIGPDTRRAPTSRADSSPVELDTRIASLTVPAPLSSPAPAGPPAIAVAGPPPATITSAPARRWRWIALAAVAALLVAVTCVVGGLALSGARSQSAEGGSPVDGSTGRMRSFLADAQRQAEQHGSASQLFGVLGSCIDAAGVAQPTATLDCGWVYLFRSADGTRVVHVRYSARSPIAAISDHSGEPVSTPLTAATLPDSDAPLRAALALRACAAVGVHDDAQIVYGHDDVSGDDYVKVNLFDPAKRRTLWVAKIVGRTLLTDYACLPPEAAEPTALRWPALGADLHAFLADATARATHETPGAQLSYVIGNCLARDGRVAGGNDECGWMYTFVAPDGSTTTVVHYQADGTPAYVSHSTSDQPPFAHADALARSEDAMAAALEDGCGNAPFQPVGTNVVYRHDTSFSHGDIVQIYFQSSAVPPPSYGAEIANGVVRPPWHHCNR